MHSGDAQGRAGAATVVALLATLVILTVATATWVISVNSGQEARGAHAAVQATAAAEASVRRFAALPSTSSQLGLGGSQALGSLTLAPGVSGAATLDRVGREWFLVRADGRHALPSATRSLGYAVWALNPTGRLAATTGVLSTSGTVLLDPSSTIRSDSMNVAPPGWLAQCAPTAAAADSVLPTGTLAATAIDTTVAVRLGRLDATWLSAHATAVVGTSVTPAPTASPSGCDATDPSNWGDPSGSGVCSGHRPLVTTATDLVVTGGLGQGTLVVPGDLTLTAGARFFGVVLVGGTLRMTEGSRLMGIVRVGGNAALSGSSIAGSSCPVLLALALPTLGTPQPGRGGWVDPL